MALRPTDRLGEVVEEAMDGAWSPFRSRIEGLSPDEYAWEPVAGCWTVRPRNGVWHADRAGDGPEPTAAAETEPKASAEADAEAEAAEPAPVTTIAWRCQHIAVDCLDWYSTTAFARDGTGFRGSEWTGDVGAALDLMDRAWAVFRSGVVGWGDDLLIPLGERWGAFADHSRLDLVFHALREVNHHGAEIALLRDLFAAQGPEPHGDR
jgi:hypothetical protein